MKTHYRRYGKIADGQTSIDVAWQLCLAHPHIRQDFEGQMKARGLADKFEQSPFWAYWFARFVITDEWLPGEDLILLDRKIWVDYVQYTENMKAVGCLGHTLRENPDFVTDEFGVIKEWKPGRGPVKMNKRPAERFGNEAAAIADRIAKEMEEFQKQRKLRDDPQEDTDED